MNADNEKTVTIKRLNSYRNTNEHGVRPGVIKYANGDYYQLPELQRGDVDIHVIALSLAKQPRYNGHTGDINKRNHGHYSIAQHCVKMAEASLIVYGDPVLALQCLIHDAGESFTGDIVHPLKVMMGEGVKDVEDKIDAVICSAFDVPYPFDERVKQMDVNICDWEMSVMLDMNKKPYAYSDYWSIEESYHNWINAVRQVQDLIELTKAENLTTGFSHRSKI